VDFQQWKRRFTAAALALAGLPGSVALAQDQFRFTNLGTLGGDFSYGVSINLQGQVAGYSIKSDGLTHAFRFNGTSMEDLGALGSMDYSFGLGINDPGDVVGYNAAFNPPHAVKFSGGNVIDLGTLPNGNVSGARHINDNGVIVGSGNVPGSSDHAFVYSNGSMQDIGVLPGGNVSRAYGINNAGKIVGYSQSTAGDRGFVFDGTSMVPIQPAAGYTVSAAYSINESNHVVGNMSTHSGSGGITHAFYNNGTQTIDLGALPGKNTSSVDSGGAINDLGMVVGWSSGTNAQSAAFFYVNGQMHDLNSLQTGSGWTLFDYARGINNHGQITGTGSLTGNNGSRAYVATPEVHYQPIASGSWGDSGAWSWGLTPGAPHPVYVDRASAGATMLAGPSTAITIAELNIGTTGAGTAELVLQNSGTITLSAGLVGNGNLTIGPKGKLSGDGTVAGDVLLQGLGTVAPGTGGPGRIAVGESFTLQTNAILEVDLGGDPTQQSNEGITFDVITVSGAGNIFTLGAVNLYVTPLANVALNQPYVIVRAVNGASVAYAGLFANLQNGNHYDDGHVVYDVTYGSSQISVSFTAVPEPSSLIFLPATALLLHCRRRRPATSR